MADTYRAAGTLDLTVHLRDPDVPAKITAHPEARSRPRMIVPIAAEATGHAGATVCGRPMLLDELWTPHAPEDRDVTCDTCFGRVGLHEEPMLC